MRETWFDARTQWFGAGTRRSALRTIGGSGLAAVLGGAGWRSAEAKRNKKGKKPPKPALTFDLARSEAAIGDTCLADVSGRVRVFELGFAERMEISIAGLPENTEFDVFVIQVPDAPFGMSWYQGDMTTNGDGRATKSFVGRFNEETFIVAPGAAPAPVVHQGEDDATNPAIDPIHTAHIGIWFNSPEDAVAAGCGDDVTPFNGDHTAGIQVLSTRGFEDDEGPLLQIAS